jgi:hypothetical protein
MLGTHAPPVELAALELLEETALELVVPLPPLPAGVVTPVEVCALVESEVVPAPPLPGVSDPQSFTQDARATHPPISVRATDALSLP